MSLPSLQPLQGTLNRKQAAHLLRRATFGPAKSTIDQFAQKTATQAVNDLFSFSASVNPPVDPQTLLMFTLPLFPQATILNSQPFQLKAYTLLWWIDLMLKDGASIREKMVFFWHKHIPTIQSRIFSGTDLYYQIALFRHFAKGNFRELAKAIVQDNAMLVHLDGQYNIAGNPQENFAREFMELFTIGKGPQDGPNSYTNYTDDDVAAGAKVLTGWQTDPSGNSRHSFNNNIVCGKVRVNNFLLNQCPTHDNSVKTFSVKFNNQQIGPANPGQLSTATDVRNEKNAFVGMVFNQVETARYLARSLYRYFVYYLITPEIESHIIDPLAQQIFADNYNIEPALKKLLSSEHFFDMDPSNNVDIDINGAIIKSPLDLVIGTYRAFEVHPSPYPLLPLNQSLLQYYDRLLQGVYYQMVPMGMALYEPPEVAGYASYYQGPGYNRNWISPSFLVSRYKFAQDFLQTLYYGGTPMYNLHLSTFVKNRMSQSEAGDPHVLVAKLAELLIPSALPAGRLTDFSNVILNVMTPNDWYYTWHHFLTTNDDVNTESTLKSILQKMMQSPEYQLL